MGYSIGQSKTIQTLKLVAFKNYSIIIYKYIRIYILVYGVHIVQTIYFINIEVRVIRVCLSTLTQKILSTLKKVY